MLGEEPEVFLRATVFESRRDRYGGHGLLHLSRQLLFIRRQRVNVTKGTRETGFPPVKASSAANRRGVSASSRKVGAPPPAIRPSQ